MAQDMKTRKEKLAIATGQFSPIPESQRLRCKIIFIDILPLGSITDKDKKISLPPEREIIMNEYGSSRRSL
jgi:hypothetical protein